MRLSMIALLAAGLAFGCQRQAPAAGRTQQETRIREATAAGSFYPGEAAALQAQARELLGTAARKAGGPVRMVLAPHAGYEFSGQVAAAAIKQLSPGFERVVILAANHSNEARYSGVSAESATCYRIPGLEVPVAKEAARLVSADGFLNVPAAHGAHVIEVQLPFLDAVAGRPFEILPLIVGRLTREQARETARALAGLADSKTVFLFSIDLSHYHPYGVATARDRACLDALVRVNADEIASCDTDGTQVLMLMTELAALQGLTPRLITYANSGDVSGDKSQVVGYGAVAYEERFELGAEESAALLALARRSLEAKVRDGVEIAVPAELLDRYPRLGAKRGAFVTLRKQGALRGCIGTLEAFEPLAQDVVRNAVNAAVEDSRFPPVKPEELAQIDVSISVLDVPRPLAGSSGDALARRLSQTKPGLIIDYQGRRSTFLPEVWDELPDPIQFLDNLCLKQGSPADCWRKPEARFQSYGSQHLEAAR